MMARVHLSFCLWRQWATASVKNKHILKVESRRDIEEPACLGVELSELWRSIVNECSRVFAEIYHNAIVDLVLSRGMIVKLSKVCCVGKKWDVVVVGSMKKWVVVYFSLKKCMKCVRDSMLVFFFGCV